MKAIGIILLSIGLSGALSGCASNPNRSADAIGQRALPRPRSGASYTEPAPSLSREEYLRARKESERERFLGPPRVCSNPAGCQY